ncbi:MAG: amino acid ABC transporter substrate-binding protein [Deltaproteobacteria bacterium]|nr:amino acid ABC transporter substrate-binding protein [Deltaproteobacteria bacterium]
MKIRIGLIIFLMCHLISFQAYADFREIRIGATVSASGKFATEVGPFKKLLAEWTVKINEQGGLLLRKSNLRLPVRMVVYDDQSDEATPRRFYQRLITEDKVHLLLGPYSSSLTFAVSSVAENERIPLLAICANSPKIYQRGYRYLTGLLDEAPRYTYRYWEMLQAEKMANTVSFIIEESLHPLSVYEGARMMAAQAGIKILSADIVPPETRDFTAVLNKLQKMDPDIIFCSANIPLASLFMRQAREFRLSPREFQVTHHSGVFKKYLGRNAEGITGQSYWVPEMKGNSASRFLEIMAKARIDLDDYPWAPAYMMALEIVEQALGQAGSLEPDRIMESLKTQTFKTLGGPNRFASNGLGQINTYPSQIQGGRYQILWPKEKATGVHQYPIRSR